MKPVKIIVFLLIASCVYAQVERYELGRRLKLLEQKLEVTKENSVRKRAFEQINKAVLSFFSFKIQDAARSIDEARLALEGKQDRKEFLWAESLFTSPDSRVYDAKQAYLKVTLDAFYAVDKPLAKKITWKLSISDSNGKSIKSLKPVTLNSLPAFQNISITRIKQGDYFLLSEVFVEERKVLASMVLVSFIDSFEKRLESLKRELEGEDKSWQAETAREYVRILQDLKQGKIREADIPAASFLSRAENYKKLIPKDGLLAIPYVDGAIQVSRVYIPDTSEKIPLVIALHGAGGSENLFFEGYGGGKALRLCKNRKWALVAPRNFGFNAEKMSELLDRLSEIYPIDKNSVFLIGHSLGSVQALTIASKKPELFRALALISAGNFQGINEKFTRLPIFIGTGTSDFSFSSSRKLYDFLVKSGAEKVELKVYQDVEHLTAVQFSLEDVFEFFDLAKI
ncbi:MAG: alpha/beta hydrolase-fold protein [Pyrinomonadaceae bacterium]|nr:alpha/beta hydrolase-fold protein [Pyrinomonadaceae bacterium]MCX7639923.1 alpha/beta hydrolase-fold protein [Pyrinomonadaceae bacterium]